MKPADRPTLSEQYEAACTTSDLGLPIGPGAGAQGILAAAAWTEVHLGSALRRMRRQWETEKPRKKQARTRQQLRSAGMPPAQAKRQHLRERMQCNLTYIEEKKALYRRLREFAEVLQNMTVHAVRLDVECADTKAESVLKGWLEEPEREPADADARLLWGYLRDCEARGRHALQQGMRGHTKHEKAR